MTTTLRPAGPERPAPDGGRARDFTVCVNGRPVGGLELSAGPRASARGGTGTGRIAALSIDEPDRRRGRGTVAALAAEEVLRLWGCARIEVTVPADAAYALRLAAALGYVESARGMLKPLPDAPPHALPAGSLVRPFTAGEYGPWRQLDAERYVAALLAHGVPREQAEQREATGFDRVLPQGRDTPGAALYALVHDGGTVGRAALRLYDPADPAVPAYVLSVEVDAAHRGRGHGRTLMLAAENACREVGSTALALTVFADNTPAVRLYESLGYRTTLRHLTKTLT
ncbi:Acetyltransferase (GNAT) family protein [Actinacidiphila alni]|uniref:Acetyltransferase (GNAT) family protein n=1 Tax=Actinacidiphila alni TaxID=380248 RepID=A0A1I2CC51_9ACTN|nr:GNAT family N-acetyltransferase [Actinacidiphila alni]SFE65798.1 Acetyltransferase (GNAT) family protein [Actinacidiphila alni]